MPSLLRDFSAPVKLHYPYSKNDLRLLLEHDTDAFNRWESGQRLSLDVMLPLIVSRQKGEQLVIDQDFVATYENILTDPTLSDNSFKTLLLTLPSEEYLGEMMAEIDVEAIHEVREFIMRSMAEELRHNFQEIYAANNERSVYSFDPLSIGKRRKGWESGE